MRIREFIQKSMSVMLSAAMITGLTPAFSDSQPVYGASDEEAPVTLFATKEQIKTSFQLDGNNDTVGKIFFGKNQDKAQEWYIVGAESTDEEEADSVVLFAASPLKDRAAYEDAWDANKEYEEKWGCVYADGQPDEVYPNHYGASALRAELKAMESDTKMFSSAEQGIMLPSRIVVEDALNETSYTVSDKLYAAHGVRNGIQATVGASIGDSEQDNAGGLRIHKKYWSDAIFWLRSAYGSIEDMALAADAGRRISICDIDRENAIVPAFELDLSSVLFASAVPVMAVHAAVMEENSTMALRFDGSKKLSDSYVGYTKDKIEINARTALTLVVQGKTENTNWYYAAPVNAGWTKITASEIRAALETYILSEPDLTKCQIWIEAADTAANLTYARMASPLTEILHTAVTDITPPVPGEQLDTTAVCVTEGIANAALTVTYTSEYVGEDDGDEGEDPDDGEDSENEDEGKDPDDGEDSDNEDEGEDPDDESDLDDEYDTDEAVYESKIESSFWQDTAEIESKIMRENDVAEFDTKYTAMVNLIPTQGYTFPENVTSTVNGQDADTELNEDGSLTVTFEFEAILLRRLTFTRISEEAMQETLVEGYTQSNTEVFRVANGTGVNIKNVHVILEKGAASAFEIVGYGFDADLTAAPNQAVNAENALLPNASVDVSVRLKHGQAASEEPYEDVLYVTGDGTEGCRIELSQEVEEQEDVGNYVEDPEADLEEGIYAQNIRVTLTSETEGAFIYYTLDGTTPTRASKLYTGPIAVNGRMGEYVTTVITAIAVKDGMDDSDESVFEYTIAIPMPTYEVTVEDGRGSGMYAAGEEVEIRANAAPAGKQFKMWRVISGGVTLEDTKSSATSFVMPSTAVKLKAVFEEIPEKMPIIVQCTMRRMIVEGQTATFVVVAKGNHLNYQWMVNRNDGKGYVVIPQAAQSSYTTEAVTVNCNGYKYKCVVSNSVGSVQTAEALLEVVKPLPKYYGIHVSEEKSGVAFASKLQANEGETITLTAEPGTGYTFLEWQVLSGGIVLSDAKNPVTAFVMPASDVSVKAVFEKEKKQPVVKKPLPEVVEVSAAWKDDYILVRWDAIEGADGYEIYASICGEKSKKVKTMQASAPRSVKIKKIENKKIYNKGQYKVEVRAYKNVNNKITYLSNSFSMHLVSEHNPVYTNVKKIKVAKSSYQIKKGKTLKINATLVKADKNKSLLKEGHGNVLRYYTSDKRIATVTENGKIKAKAKGKCTINLVSINGVKKSVRVTVV